MLNYNEDKASENLSDADINLLCDKIGIEIKNSSIPLKEEKTTAVENILLSKKYKIKNDIEITTKKEKIGVKTCEKETQTVNEYDSDSDSEQELYRQYLLTQKNN